MPPPRRRRSSPARGRSTVIATEDDIEYLDGPVENYIRRTATTSRAAKFSPLAVLRAVFLPAGYPASVRPEYLRFQAYDTLQAACSYLRNILTTSAILRGAGVGEEAASPMAAALAWVLRDGFGMFGSLVFSYFAGSNFDWNCKEWRLFADVINDVGLTLDMLAPLAGRGTGFMLVAAVGACCKTICGMTAGATRASITAHFALEGNLADVSAKEGAQETAVTLVGLVAGAAVARALGESEVLAWVVFVGLTLLHVWANWHGVGALTFSWLNTQRAVLVCRHWVETGEALTPAECAARERLWRPPLLALRGPRLGVRLGDVCPTPSMLRNLTERFGEANYLLRREFSALSARPLIAFRRGATSSDALRALLHTAYLEQSAEGTAFQRAQQAWPRFAAALQRAGWDEAGVRLDGCASARRCEWGARL